MAEVSPEILKDYQLLCCSFSSVFPFDPNFLWRIQRSSQCSESIATSSDWSACICYGAIFRLEVIIHKLGFLNTSCSKDEIWTRRNDVRIENFSLTCV